MAKSKQSTVNYRDLSDELDGILARLQSGDLTIDEAMPAYERGLIIVRQLEDYLKNAETTVTKLKAKFTDE